MDPLSAFAAEKEQKNAVKIAKVSSSSSSGGGGGIPPPPPFLTPFNNDKRNSHSMAMADEESHEEGDDGESHGEQEEEAQAEEEPASPPLQPVAEDEGNPLNHQATSSVFNLNSYDGGQGGEAVQEEKASWCCELDRTLDGLPTSAFLPMLSINVPLIRDQERPMVIIEEASKQQDMAGKTFITYLIHATLPGGMSNIKLEAKHRYSDFETLRGILEQRFPYVVIPPIPEKHSVALYATKAGKAQQDPAIIAKRKRLLQSFLNRVLAHPLLRRIHEVHLFLKGEAGWNEGEGSPGGRKRPVMMIEGATTLRKPDPHFSTAQAYTQRFGNQITFIRKIHKKFMAQYQELTSTYMELGALYNGWSLGEGGLAEAIEQMGQAVDSTLTATTILATSMEERVGDILAEYQKFTLVLQGVLNMRHKAHVAFEQVSEKLILKQSALTKLETSEHESQRLAAVLAVEGAPPQIPIARPSGFMASINAILDNDPDTTRRITISKTKDKISQLEVGREEARTTLLALNAKIQRDLDRFQRQKIRDLHDLVVGFALVQREFHVRAIAAWQGAKSAIERIEP